MKQQQCSAVIETLARSPHSLRASSETLRQRQKSSSLWEIVKLMSLKLSDSGDMRQKSSMVEKNEGMRKLLVVGEGDSIVMCVQKIQQKRKKSEEKFQEKDRVCRFHPSLYFFPIQCLPSWHPGIHASPPNFPQLHVNIGPTPKKISHSIYINSSWP